MITLEETFYVGEHGFYFTVQTGLDMTGVTAGDIRSVLRRPNGSSVRRSVLVADVIDVATGTVLIPIGAGDLVAPGKYQMQVWVRDQALNLGRPSHPFSFEVETGLATPTGAFE
jgi:hypothetical protein